MVGKPRIWWPGINDQHPCAAGLVWGGAMWEGGGLNLNPVRHPKPATFGGGAANPSWTGCAEGHCLSFDGGDYVDSGVETVGRTGLFCEAGKPFSVLVRFASSGIGSVIARGSAAGGNRAFQIYLQAAVPQVIVNLRGQTTGVAWSYNATNVWHTILVIWDGVAAAVYNSEGQSSALAVGVAAEDVGQRIIVGACTNGTGYFFNGLIGAALIWDRVLSPVERALMLADPFAPLRRPARMELPWSDFEIPARVKLVIFRYSGIEYWAFYWRSGGDGIARLRIGDGYLPGLVGLLDRLETTPDSVNVPTADYDVRLWDILDNDVLQALGNNRSATATEIALLGNKPMASHGERISAGGKLELRIANAGKNKAGMAVLVVLTG